MNPYSSSTREIGEKMAIADTLKKWFGRAKEEASELSEKAGPLVEKAKEASKEAMEKAAPMVEKAKESGKEAFEKAKDVAEDAWDKVEDRIEERRGHNEATGSEAGNTSETPGDTEDT